MSTRQSTGLPCHLWRLVKAASTQGVQLELNKPAEVLKQELPIFYHIGGTDGRSMENSTVHQCLREKHKVKTIVDYALVVGRLNHPRGHHVAHRNCECVDCDTDHRRNGCNNPHRCAIVADKKMWKLRLKWCLETETNRDGLTLTQHRHK